VFSEQQLYFRDQDLIWGCQGFRKKSFTPDPDMNCYCLRHSQRSFFSDHRQGSAFCCWSLRSLGHLNFYAASQPFHCSSPAPNDTAWATSLSRQPTPRSLIATTIPPLEPHEPHNDPRQLPCPTKQKTTRPPTGRQKLYLPLPGLGGQGASAMPALQNPRSNRAQPHPARNSASTRSDRKAVPSSLRC